MVRKAKRSELFLPDLTGARYDAHKGFRLKTRTPHERSIDIRLITATNQDLLKLVEAGKFREDLYYRLNVIPLTVPPLRDRADDIPLLATHFLEKARASSGTRIKGFSTEAMAKLIAYPWPGNVRELKNIVERLVGTVDADLVRLEHLPPNIAQAAPAVSDLGIGPVPENVEQLKDSKRRLKDKVYERVERAFVIRALEQTGWNITQAATLVGMQRTYFHALMRKYGIKRGE